MQLSNRFLVLAAVGNLLALAARAQPTRVADYNCIGGAVYEGARRGDIASWQSQQRVRYQLQAQ